jgi:hypothetical protein
MDIEKMTDAELLAEINSLEYMIYVVDCYSVSDMVRQEMCFAEAERRGLELTQKPKLWTIAR